MSLCDHIQEQLSGYVDAELSPDERRLVHEHLAECRLCRHRLETLQRVAGHVRELPVLEAPPELLINVSREIRRGTDEDRSTDRPGLLRSWRIVRMASAAAILLLASYVGVHVFESTVVNPETESPALAEPTAPKQDTRRDELAKAEQGLKKGVPARGGAETESLNLAKALPEAAAPVEVRRITIRTRNVTEAVQTVQGLTLARGDQPKAMMDQAVMRSEGTTRSREQTRQVPQTGTFIQSAPDRVVLVMDHDLARVQYAALEGAFKPDNVSVEDVELRGDRVRLQELAEAARVAAVDAEVSDEVTLRLSRKQWERDRAAPDEDDHADRRLKGLARRTPPEPVPSHPALEQPGAREEAGAEPDNAPADKPGQQGNKAAGRKEADGTPPPAGGPTRGDDNDADTLGQAKDVVATGAEAQGFGGAGARQGGRPSAAAPAEQARIVIWEVNFVPMKTDPSAAPE